ncbi:hypothetical protein C3432_01815 [Citrobacter amalonaticus]|uniref:Uncharacterized protein n=1 Tax=Citrobacter amalonaticus TaxID=35703 RepID=A0A2S4S2G9_CITAM|nr:hypothetical protein [Citrobacter amalonaticus]POT59483.1 hypothetical protein C3432_01815 [Citrobacter amalonaticus]POT77613.1 hypothetical protein C3436_09485 [Citrobacter amalonaticus]POU68065.1 hypothetical protein C3430_03020 [Citrobacter amalonaticus]POV07669.1 hypothetical protein C3424_03030 [Citrobacter amalonaticus]
MSCKLSRPAPVDQVVHQPVAPGKDLTGLARSLRAVGTAPEIRPAKAEGDTPKFGLLEYRDRYRESVAINVMSALSDDFKTAYDKGDKTQKKNLENVATVVYLANLGLAPESPRQGELKERVNNWLHAIKEGNKNPRGEFTLEQNTRVNHKNKERNNYLKAVNELMLLIKEEFKTAKALAKIAKEDVDKRCAEVLAHFGIDISADPEFLDESAFKGEKICVLLPKIFLR